MSFIAELNHRTYNERVNGKLIAMYTTKLNILARTREKPSMAARLERRIFRKYIMINMQLKKSNGWAQAPKKIKSEDRLKMRIMGTYLPLERLI